MTPWFDPVLDVRFYSSRTGQEPVRDWLRSLPPHDRKVAGDDIKTVQFGWPVGMPLVRHLESDLWEVRVHLSNGIARILFTSAGSTMYLVHGFVKKTPKTPRQDLELARKRSKDLHRDPSIARR